ncbi:MAG: phosphoribosylamine--glycine ligase [Firmicutes bacterium]|nr:phosphoribosylamine--glycine ligase [Bacillota bacterium]
MNVLVIGSGGREYALCLKIAESPLLKKLYCAPGSDAIAEIAEVLPIKASANQELCQAAKSLAIDLVVIGPDDALAAGLADDFLETGIEVFGPSKEAAKLEWSKAFAKEFMSKLELPTAKWASFDDYHQALAYIEKEGFPIVIKASGLALGKGVIIAEDLEAAQEALKSMLVEQTFGSAGATVVIEEFLIGREFSLLAFSDGKNIRLMPPVEDHKQVFDHDQGPNTGGMGCISPLNYVDDEMLLYLQEEVFTKTIEELDKSRTPFVGVLFIGFMLTLEGPKILEFNARFGDPETQTLMMLLESDLLETLSACAQKHLDQVKITWKNQHAACLILTSGGYPGDYNKGYEISGLEDLPEDITVFHAGTAKKNSAYFTNGGRVLGLASSKKDLASAVNYVYEQARKVHFKDIHYRRDIGRRQM